jgi:hypothetical protein
VTDQLEKEQGSPYRLGEADSTRTKVKVRRGARPS